MSIGDGCDFWTASPPSAIPESVLNEITSVALFVGIPPRNSEAVKLDSAYLTDRGDCGTRNSRLGDIIGGRINKVVLLVMAEFSRGERWAWVLDRAEHSALCSSTATSQQQSKT